jgi:fructose-1,6-bisphosphatase/sedoheptulose 1,7-bisphosphatase-like protein
VGGRLAAGTLLVSGLVSVEALAAPPLVVPDNVVDLDETPQKNLRELAKAKGSEVSDLVACILDRPRHQELIAKVRETGARIIEY